MDSSWLNCDFKEVVVSLRGQFCFARRESDLRVALGRFSNFFSFETTLEWTVVTKSLRINGWATGTVDAANA